MLERYLAIRQMYPEWFRNLDVEDKAISEIIDSGYLFPLPERDDLGRRVVFSIAQKFDPYKYSSDHMAKVHSIAVESLMDDEENQIRGYTYINDESGLSMGHLSLWSLTDMRNMSRCVQYSTPMRHKSTHFINVPSFASKMFEFFSSLLNDKLKKRITVHKDVEDLKKHIDIRILPKEYGGTVPMADMIREYKRKLSGMRESLLALDDMEIEVDSKAYKSSTRPADDDTLGIAGSFRKLEVD
ncbi:hypothetical protein AAG570_007254 [Ranatra chinensis]|uniref:CRAL-TRIO domain-containing protein n=1 Tax=Ranatra chinensis TaxID=642074 RepID=A0ABD0XVM4_9HEMI